MLSNDVEALELGQACDALLLTAKARVIATATVWRRDEDDFLLLTEPELGERLLGELRRFRFAARATIEPEEHVSTLVLGGEASSGAIPNGEYGVPAFELLDRASDSAGEVDPAELELLRIRARTPRFGYELDDRVLPAEAGLDERAVSFTKGCYPGQEPVARLHYRGHANRGLRVLELEGDLPAYDTELSHAGAVVGRVTSAVIGEDGRVVALGYVRREVPTDAALELADGRPATQAR
jgi:folate-binding protein YgfZ